jgi:hypothetical protein
VVVGVAVPPAGQRRHAVAEAEAQAIGQEALEGLRPRCLHRRVLELQRPVASVQDLARFHTAEQLEDVAAGRPDA